MPAPTWKDLTVPQLKEELKDRDLDQKGLKKVLIKRLEDDDAAKAAEAPANVAGAPAGPAGFEGSTDYATAMMEGIHPAYYNSPWLYQQPYPAQMQNSYLPFGYNPAAQVQPSYNQAAQVEHPYRAQFTPSIDPQLLQPNYNPQQPRAPTPDDVARQLRDTTLSPRSQGLRHAVPPGSGFLHYQRDAQMPLTAADANGASESAATGDTIIPNNEQAVGLEQDSQQRKRRSNTPPPTIDNDATESDVVTPRRARIHEDTPPAEMDFREGDIQESGGSDLDKSMEGVVAVKQEPTLQSARSVESARHAATSLPW